MHGLLKDLVFGWRLLVRRPLVASMLVLSLALGIGANTVLYPHVVKATI
jgi:hypothetical protein